MNSFQTDAFGAACGPLLQELPTPPLGPGVPNGAALDLLRALTVETVFSEKSVVDREMALGCLSALWLLHNYLDESHQISQEIGSASGSYWHGIMHRREPDFSNSKYWFRRVGEHPIFPDLCKTAAELADSVSGKASYLRDQDRWDPFRFVDLCQAVIETDSDDERLCEAIALAEWRLLFAHCYENA